MQRNKKLHDEHIHDLSTKLKTITDRHRESTTVMNNDIKTKKQQIEQYTQQIEQIVQEKTQLENDRSDLERQVCVYFSEFSEKINVFFCILSVVLKTP